MHPVSLAIDNLIKRKQIMLIGLVCEKKGKIYMLHCPIA